MYCPVCHKILQNKEFETQNIDECPDCGGVWLDREELYKVAAHLIADNKVDGLSVKESFNRKAIMPETKDRLERQCPHCGIKMTLVNYCVDSNIFLDRCSVCAGIWADKDEIIAVARFIKGNPVAKEFSKTFTEMAAAAGKSKRKQEAIVDLSNDLVNKGKILHLAWPILPFPVIGLI